MGDTEPPGNALHKTKYTQSSKLKYGVRLDPVATFYFVGWIKRKLLTLPFFLFVL